MEREVVMTKSEILQVAKPILYNTEMVRAILDGRKTMTRRLIKAPYDLRKYEFYKLHDNSDGRITTGKDKLCAGFYTEQQIFYVDGEKHIDAHYYVSPYNPGQYLYVRETWYLTDCLGLQNGYIYKASVDERQLRILEKTTGIIPKWRPSIHMPKEAARIFLKVTDVRVERLQEITNDDAISEGIEQHCYQDENGNIEFESSPIDDFAELWDTTIKKKDLEQYGWEWNPWVWVVEFEKVEVDG